ARGDALLGPFELLLALLDRDAALEHPLGALLRVVVVPVGVLVVVPVLVAVAVVVALVVALVVAGCPQRRRRHPRGRRAARVGRRALPRARPRIGVGRPLVRAPVVRGVADRLADRVDDPLAVLGRLTRPAHRGLDGLLHPLLRPLHAPADRLLVPVGGLAHLVDGALDEPAHGLVGVVRPVLAGPLPVVPLPGRGA